MNHYILASLLAFILSAVLTPFIKQLAWRWHIVDRPDQIRKLQTKPVALLGGWAIFIAARMIVIIYGPVRNYYFLLPLLQQLSREGWGLIK